MVLLCLSGGGACLTNYFFSTLRQCNTTLIIETVNGSTLDGPASLDYTLQIAGDQLEKDMIEFRKSQARPGNASNNEEDLGGFGILGSDGASLVGSVKGASGGCNVCAQLRETNEQLKKCVIKRNESMESLSAYSAELRVLCIKHKVPQPLRAIPYLPGTSRGPKRGGGGGKGGGGGGDSGKAPGVQRGGRGGGISKRNSRTP